MCLGVALHFGHGTPGRCRPGQGLAGLGEERLADVGEVDAACAANEQLRANSSSSVRMAADSPDWETIICSAAR